MQKVEQIQQPASMDEQGGPHWAQPQKQTNKQNSEQKLEIEIGYPSEIERCYPKAGAKTRKGCEVQEELL